MHHQIDSLAHLNRLRYLPPREKLLFTTILFVLSYLGENRVRLIISIWLLIWIVGYAKIPWSFYGKLLLIPLGFWLMSLPAIALEIEWLGVHLSKAGIIQARELLMKSMTLTSCLYFMILTTPVTEILRVLENIGCPHLIVELLALMYRFIGTLAETSNRLILAQQSRGGYGNPKRAIVSLSLLITQLLKQTLENYRQIVLGLQSRNFTGNLTFWQPNLHKSNPRYTLEALIGCCGLLSYIIWEHASKLYSG